MRIGSIQLKLLPVGTMNCKDKNETNRVENWGTRQNLLFYLASTSNLLFKDADIGTDLSRVYFWGQKSTYTFWKVLLFIVLSALEEKRLLKL